MYILHSCWKLSYNNIILVSLTILFPLEKSPSGCGLLVLTEEQEAHVELGNVQHGMIVHEKKKSVAFFHISRVLKDHFVKNRLKDAVFVLQFAFSTQEKLKGLPKGGFHPGTAEVSFGN